MAEIFYGTSGKFEMEGALYSTPQKVSTRKKKKNKYELTSVQRADHVKSSANDRRILPSQRRARQFHDLEDSNEDLVDLDCCLPSLPARTHSTEVDPFTPEDEDAQLCLQKRILWNGNSDTLKRVVPRSVDPSVMIVVGTEEPALIYAARRGDEQCVRYLLNHGVNANVTDHMGRDALTHAALNGHAQCVQLLLDNTDDDKILVLPDPDYPMVDTTTLTCQKNAPFSMRFKILEDDTKLEISLEKLQELLRLLLDTILRPDLHDYVNEIFLLGQGRAECIELLLEAMSDFTPSKVSYDFIESVFTCNIAGMLSEPNMEAFENLFLLAAESGQKLCLEMLLSSGLDITEITSECLRSLIFSDNRDCLEVLLKSPRIDINAMSKLGMTALMHAVILNRPTCITLLLDYKADPTIVSSCGATVLSMATKSGHNESVKALLANEWSAFSKAAMRRVLMTYIDDSYIVTLITQRGIDINFVQTVPAYEEAHSPLTLAIRRNLGHIVAILIQSRADLSLNNPLLQAARYGQGNVLKALLDAGADPNQRTTGSNSPLYVAVSGKHFVCFRTLIEYDANPFIMEEHGRSVFDFLLEKIDDLNSIYMVYLRTVIISRPELIQNPNARYYIGKRLVTRLLNVSDQSTFYMTLDLMDLLELGLNPNMMVESNDELLFVLVRKNFSLDTIAKCLSVGGNPNGWYYWDQFKTQELTDVLFDQKYLHSYIFSPMGLAVYKLQVDKARLLWFSGSTFNEVWQWFNFLRDFPEKWFPEVEEPIDDEEEKRNEYFAAERIRMLEFLREICDEPRSLLKQCRIRIKQILGRKLRNKSIVKKFELPAILESFLSLP